MDNMKELNVYAQTKWKADGRTEQNLEYLKRN